MALRPLPAVPYVVTQRHLRYVGKRCLVAFDANFYSVPARKVPVGSLNRGPTGGDHGAELSCVMMRER